MYPVGNERDAHIRLQAHYIADDHPAQIFGAEIVVRDQAYMSVGIIVVTS